MSTCLKIKITGLKTVQKKRCFIYEMHILFINLTLPIRKNETKQKHGFSSKSKLETEIKVTYSKNYCYSLEPLLDLKIDFQNCDIYNGAKVPF